MEIRRPNPIFVLQKKVNMKSFDELIDKVCWSTYLVGQKEMDETDDTPDDDCYWVSVRDVKSLLEEMRKRTLSELSENRLTFKLIQTIVSDDSWEPKWHGVIFVKEESHIEPLWSALCEQDDYWESEYAKKLIKILPQNNVIQNMNELRNYCEYVGKVDIYGVPSFRKKMLERGIEFFIYQYYPEHY